MSNWGQANKDNTINYGKAPKNDKTKGNFGASCFTSDSPQQTNLTGETGGGFTNTKSYYTSDDPIIPIQGANNQLDYLKGENKLTASFWFKSVASGNGTLPFVSIVAGRTVLFKIAINANPANSTLQLVIDGNVVISTNVATTDWTTQWYHLILTYDASTTPSTATAFINGVNANVTTLTNTTFPNVTYPTFDIGNTTAGTIFQSYYTQIAFWKTNLTNAEMLAIYNSGCPADITTYAPNTWLKIDDAVVAGTGASFPNSGSEGTAFTSTGALAVHVLPNAPCP